MCKEYFYVAIFVSAVIALYELFFWRTGTDFIIVVLAAISAFYGYALLKCCCCKPARRRR